MATLSNFNGVTWCRFTIWKEQERCDYSEKSPKRDCCLYMRLDGTCSEPNVCAEMSIFDAAEKE